MSNTNFLKQISGVVPGGIITQVDWDLIDYSPQVLAAKSAGYRTHTMVLAPYTTKDEVVRMLDKLGDIFADVKDDASVPRGYITCHVRG